MGDPRLEQGLLGSLVLIVDTISNNTISYLPKYSRQCSFQYFGNGGGPSELGKSVVKNGNWEKLKCV